MTAYWNKTAFNTGLGAVTGACVALLAGAGLLVYSQLHHGGKILVLFFIFILGPLALSAGGFAGAIVGFLLPIRSDRPFFIRQLPLKLAVAVCLTTAVYAGIISPALTRREKSQNLKNSLSLGKSQDVRNLIEHGAPVNVAKGEYAPLYLAAEKGQVETCQYLLSRGADINHRNLSDETALWIALAFRHHEVATLLVNSGADVNLTDDRGESPLMLAVRDEDTEMIQTLISKGADVNHRVSGGSYSPLITTIMFDRVENAKLLLEAGADPNLADLHGRNPLSYATAKGDQQMIDLLVAHRAR